MIKDASVEILDSVRGTPYACSSVIELSGGIANATYRGKLERELQDGTETVILKHSEEHFAKAPHASLSTTRCRTEQALLAAVQETPVHRVHHGGVTVQSPRIYDFILQKNTQIMQDVPHESTLIEWLRLPNKGEEDAAKAAAIGKALGTWLAQFHSWSQNCADADLTKVVRANTDSLGKDLAHAKLRVVKQETEDKKMHRYVSDILFPTPRATDIIVHGDFSTRNILFQDASSLDSSTNSAGSLCSLAVVDWECSCYADFTRDVANIISDFYMQHHFNGGDKAPAALQAFITSYSRLTEEAAYRTVAQVGENFFYRRVYAPKSHVQEQPDELVRFGIDLVTMGVERDRAGIESSFLACLLEQR